MLKYGSAIALAALRGCSNTFVKSGSRTIPPNKDNIKPEWDERSPPKQKLKVTSALLAKAKVKTMVLSRFGFPVTEHELHLILPAVRLELHD